MDFDVVIVGSGFGGSVSALRLAENGNSVCVLERGKKYPPGSFPRRPIDVRSNVWDPTNSLYGLFEIFAFEGIDAVVSSGLGGGSLIYANVLIEKPESWFHYRLDGQELEWPIKYTDISTFYNPVRGMLSPVPYPTGPDVYAETKKSRNFNQACQDLGLKEETLNLAISFSKDSSTGPELGVEINGPSNLHNEKRFTCKLCGECFIGCNYGSKNTLDYTYLSRAQDAGAVLKTQCEVKTIDRGTAGGYVVTFLERSFQNDSMTPIEETKQLRCRKLILSAGTFGSTYLLLKNRSRFPDLSSKLGTHFSGNGDLISFALKCKAESGSSTPRRIDASYGPTITGGYSYDNDQRFYLEDFGWPGSIDWIIESMDFSKHVERWEELKLRHSQAHQIYDTNVGKEFTDLIGDSYGSACTLPVVGMGLDSPDGNFSLRDGKLQLDWNSQNQSANYFDSLRAQMKKIANALYGDYHDYLDWFLKRPISAHPLGGCPMGTSSSDGVVDEFGRVFGYEGLYVFDGSIMPGPIGPNPSMTIAAIAERCVQKMISP